MSLVRILRHTDANFAEQLSSLRHQLHSGNVVSVGGDTADVPAIVADVLRQVQTGGDSAVARLVNKLDGANVTEDSLRVGKGELSAAHAEQDPEFLVLMREVIANIREYQRHILHRDPPPLMRGTRKLGVRYTPIDRVAVYVPGGKALYPSSVLMTAVPALVAGVSQVVMLSPPTGGNINPMALALAHELGIEEVYRAGGAVAIAAAAFGTESLRPVHKIVGPGNAFVAEAKRQLFGRVGIDSIAGPSEVLIVADQSAKAAWVAADMLAQAEHNPGSAILVTTSEVLAQEVRGELASQLKTLSRSEVTRPSLEAYSAIVVTSSLDAACDIANAFATEHLQIVTADNQHCAERIRHAGALFIGSHCPVPLGDYYAGPSHVLPTGGTARFFGPLSANDFLKSSSTLEYDAPSLAEDAPRVADFARREGLTAHAHSATIRGKRPNG